MAALTKTVQLVTDSEAVVKISGSDLVASVINISTDILAANQIVYPVGGTPVANIIGFQWSGEPGAVYRVNRGGVRVASLLADNGNFMDFVELFPSENTNNTSDISVTIADAAGTAVKQGELWIRIRKVSGYASKIETAVYGVYDDLTQVGS
jgi:hypothetical protein